jgi:hypothetical protein
MSEIKGNKIIPLFRFVTITDGDSANNLFKVSIANISKDNEIFDVQVRSINDTDANPVVLESFRNCSLNPNSGNDYLGAKIGTTDDSFVTKSKYIMVEINDDPLVSNSVPMGFAGYEVKNIDGYQPTKITYNLTYNEELKQSKQYFGLSNISGVDSDFFKFNGLDVSGITLTDGFHMEPLASAIEASTGEGFPSFYSQTLDNESYLSALSDKKLMKFTAYFYGGFDGWDVFRENRTIGNAYQYNRYLSAYSGVAYDLPFSEFNGSELEKQINIPNIPANKGITSDYYAYWSAIRTFSNPELVDINVFATPGIDTINNSSLVNEAIDMLENERKDSIYVLTTPDKPIGTLDDTKFSMYTAEDIVSDLDDTGIDTSFAATYFPWVKFYDKTNAQYIYLPPTKDVVRNMAYTDNTAYAWFPPAGLLRGNVDCEKAKKNLVESEEDTLYDGRINAIKSLSSEGVKVMGQKTLLSVDNQLNRIGVRRLMLYLRKSIRKANLPLIFEPNDNTTKSRFLEIVTPILNSVQSGRGISAYEIVIDDSLEAKARHEMNVQIFIKPIGALEYINIDFMITDEGFDFNSI